MKLKDDSDNLFDHDDDIVINQQDNTITLVKNNDSDSVDLNKVLKNIGGKWNIELNYSPQSSVNQDPDEWIANKQYDILINVYEDLYNRLPYIDILHNITFSDFCSYLYDCKSTKRQYDIQIEEFKMYNLKNPSVHEWAVFFINDIKYLYNNYKAFSFGTLYDWILFCFEFSNTKQLPAF